MGDGADMMRESEENAFLYHDLGWCSCDENCFYCSLERSMELRAPGDPDEMDSYDDE